MNANCCTNIIEHFGFNLAQTLKLLHMLKLKILLVLAFISTTVFAQTAITGTVLSENGTPLNKATVSLKGTKATTTTDENGRFTISTNNTKHILIVSFVGYETANIGLQPNQTDISITLKVLAEQLSDVVVIGYGTAKKKDLTGSI